MRIYEAQHNLPWIIEGAAVAVSIVCFAPDGDRCAVASTLDGRRVRAIRSDLRDADLPFDLRNLRRLEENRRVAFQGVKLAGSRADDDQDPDEEEKGFVINQATADRLVNAGGNPMAAPTPMLFGGIGAAMKPSGARAIATSSTLARRLQRLKPRRMQLLMLISIESSAIGGEETAKDGRRGAGGSISAHGAR
jgi:hypothetical protein